MVSRLYILTQNSVYYVWKFPCGVKHNLNVLKANFQNLPAQMVNNSKLFDC